MIPAWSGRSENHRKDPADRGRCRSRDGSEPEPCDGQRTDARAGESALDADPVESGPPGIREGWNHVSTPDLCGLPQRGRRRPPAAEQHRHDPRFVLGSTSRSATDCRSPCMTKGSRPTARSASPRESTSGLRPSIGMPSDREAEGLLAMREGTGHDLRTVTADSRPDGAPQTSPGHRPGPIRPPGSTSIARTRHRSGSGPSTWISPA
jgi:hypothetical protein